MYATSLHQNGSKTFWVQLLMCIISLAPTTLTILLCRFAVAYTIFYHWLGGLRHFAWDHHKIGNQVHGSSPWVF